MKKIGAILVCILLITALAVPALAAETTATTTFSISANKSSVTVGDTITFTVSVDSTGECTSLGYKPVYDENVYELVDGGKAIMKSTFEDIKDPADIGNVSVVLSNYNESHGGTAVWFTPAVTPKGEVGTFVLKVIAMGGNTEVSVDPRANNVSENLTTEVKPVSVTITEKTGEDIAAGDANGDGIINNVDAMMVMQRALNMSVNGLNEDVCDVNGDGTINNVDAMLIMQYALKIISTFPAQS